MGAWCGLLCMKHLVPSDAARLFFDEFEKSKNRRGSPSSRSKRPRPHMSSHIGRGSFTHETCSQVKPHGHSVCCSAFSFLWAFSSSCFQSSQRTRNIIAASSAADTIELSPTHAFGTSLQYCTENPEARDPGERGRRACGTRVSKLASSHTERNGPDRLDYIV